VSNKSAIFIGMTELSLSVKKPTRKWYIWFFPTHKPTIKKTKEPFFANAQTDKRKE
jgi:hypothetical protein